VDLWSKDELWFKSIGYSEFFQTISHLHLNEFVFWRPLGFLFTNLLYCGSYQQSLFLKKNPFYALFEALRRMFFSLPNNWLHATFNSLVRFFFFLTGRVK
jgi:hypothetical protein